MKDGKRLADILFVITLFCLYLVCTLTLCIIGINVYQKTINDSESNYNVRTSVLYITEKSRQNLSEQSIRIDEVNGSSALVLSQTIEGSVYDTWMYVEDGYLCEVLMPQGSEVIADIGQKIMPMDTLELSIDENSVLTIGVKDSKGESYYSNIYFRHAQKGGK